MPSLYRSRSVRRFEESTNRLTDMIEKANIKVLATASVQLFISTPQLDKWFKSSTGTLCFLKDFQRKNFYYFRLYSLMQGQLWEQEMECPFVYSKLSNVFHYLAVNRFNFGFRFICEDEAERFFSVITKFSAIKSSDSETTSTGSTQASGSISDNPPNSKTFQRNTSATPLGSIATAAAAVASATVMANSNHSSSTTTLTNWSTGSSSTIKAVAKYVCAPNSHSSDSTRSRRVAHSADRKRKIEKRDISCPFRCSCNDLHLNKNQPNVIIHDTVETTRSNLYEKSDKLPQSKKISQRALNEINSLLKRKYSSSVNRAQSTASIPIAVSPKFLEKHNEPKRIAPTINASSSTSTSYSFTISPNSNNSKSQLIKEKSSNKSETKLSDSCNNIKDDREIEIIKEILIKYNVPIDRKFIRSLRNYICNKYGNIDAFNKSLESNEELKKFNLFVAEYSASLVDPNLNKSPEKTDFISFTNQKAFEATWKTPTNASANIYCNTPQTPTIATTANNSKRYSFCNSYQTITMTPVSSNSNSKSKPPSSDANSKTPVIANVGLNLLNQNKIKPSNKTPSHSPQYEKFRQQLMNNNNTTPNSVENAPPKPPRRISLIISN